jgi:hypothetical protein
MGQRFSVGELGRHAMWTFAASNVCNARRNGSNPRLQNYKGCNSEATRPSSRDVPGFIRDMPRDYRKNYATDTAISSTLTSVYNELARWESVPDRREPYTLEMLIYLKQSVERTASCQDSMVAAMADWFKCGLSRVYAYQNGPKTRTAQTWDATSATSNSRRVPFASAMCASRTTRGPGSRQSKCWKANPTLRCASAD